MQLASEEVEIAQWEDCDHFETGWLDWAISKMIAEHDEHIEIKFKLPRESITPSGNDE